MMAVCLIGVYNWKIFFPYPQDKKKLTYFLKTVKNMNKIAFVNNKCKSF